MNTLSTYKFFTISGLLLSLIIYWLILIDLLLFEFEPLLYDDNLYPVESSHKSRFFIQYDDHCGSFGANSLGKQLLLLLPLFTFGLFKFYFSRKDTIDFTVVNKKPAEYFILGTFVSFPAILSRIIMVRESVSYGLEQNLFDGIQESLNEILLNIGLTLLIFSLTWIKTKENDEVNMRSFTFFFVMIFIALFTYFVYFAGYAIQFACD